MLALQYRRRRRHHQNYFYFLFFIKAWGGGVMHFGISEGIKGGGGVKIWKRSVVWYEYYISGIAHYW